MSYLNAGLLNLMIMDVFFLVHHFGFGFLLCLCLVPLLFNIFPHSQFKETCILVCLCFKLKLNNVQNGM